MRRARDGPLLRFAVSQLSLHAARQHPFLLTGRGAPARLTVSIPGESGQTGSICATPLDFHTPSFEAMGLAGALETSRQAPLSATNNDMTSSLLSPFGELPQMAHPTQREVGQCGLYLTSLCRRTPAQETDFQTWTCLSPLS